MFLTEHKQLNHIFVTQSQFSVNINFSLVWVWPALSLTLEPEEFSSCLKSYKSAVMFSLRQKVRIHFYLHEQLSFV